jgi:predicted amidophosphoribosyltransferase
MICPACKNEIERDSFYCDQCGEEILICPACKNRAKESGALKTAANLFRKSF